MTTKNKNKAKRMAGELMMVLIVMVGLWAMIWVALFEAVVKLSRRAGVDFHDED
jgi:hypothetical protein